VTQQPIHSMARQRLGTEGLTTALDLQKPPVSDLCGAGCADGSYFTNDPRIIIIILIIQFTSVLHILVFTFLPNRLNVNHEVNRNKEGNKHVHAKIKEKTRQLFSFRQ
jgi:hypothetical protein